MLTDEQRAELGACDECMAAVCTVCGHEPCPACLDDCDNFDCIEWNPKTGTGKKKHVCIFARCAKHAASEGVDVKLGRGLPMGPPLEPVRALDADWQFGREVLRWQFNLPTKIEGFEVNEPIGGDLLSVLIGEREQLATLPACIPIVGAAQFHRAGAIMSSPARGWKIGPLLLESLRVGVVLTLRVKGFHGQLRPFGCQVGSGPRDGGKLE